MRYRASCLIGSSKRRAGKRGLPHTITTDDIEARIANGVCELTGLPFVLETDYEWTNHPMAPTIDRIDPNKGYVPENIQMVCAGINQLKSQYPTTVVRVLAKAYLKATNGVKL